MIAPLLLHSCLIHGGFLASHFQKQRTFPCWGWSQERSFHCFCVRIKGEQGVLGHAGTSVKSSYCLSGPWKSVKLDSWGRGKARRYRTVPSCLFTCDRGEVAGRTGGSSVETAVSSAAMRSVLGVRLVASSAWRFWNCSSELLGFLYRELGPAPGVFPAEGNRYSGITSLIPFLHVTDLNQRNSCFIQLPTTLPWSWAAVLNHCITVMSYYSDNQVQSLCRVYA